MKNWIITGLCINLFACGGDDDKKVEEQSIGLDLSTAVTSVLDTEQGLYYMFKDDVYLVQNQDFENPYCIGNTSVVRNGVKGLKLTRLDNGILTAISGVLADGPIELEHSLPNFDSYYFLLSHNPASLIAADFDGGAMISTDGSNWTQLISQNKELDRRLWDIEFMGSIHQAVAINYEGGNDFSASMLSNGEWHLISSVTKMDRFVYANGKVLGLNNQSIRVLDAVDGRVLNTIDIKDTFIQYVALLDDSLIFTDGKTGNFKFDLDTEQVSEFTLSQDIGFITGISQLNNNIVFGTSSGIWLKNENNVSQIFDSSSISTSEINCQPVVN